MKVVLIRHGETVHNTENRMSGWTEATLSAKGVEQAKALRERMKNVAIHRLVTSGMERADETASIVFPHLKKTSEKNHLLKEMNFGTMEGLTMGEIKHKYPEDFLKLHEMTGRYVFPEGESLRSFHQRIQSAARQLQKYPEGETIAIVAHSGTIRSLLSGWIAKDWRAHWRFRIHHCSITVVDFYDGFPVLSLCNDTLHLHDPLSSST